MFSQRKAKLIFTRVKASIYVTLISAILLVLDINFAQHNVAYGTAPNGTHYCKFNTENLLFKMRQFLIGLIPLCVIIPCNILIIIKVILQIRSMRGVIALTQQQILKKKSIKVTILTLSINLNFIILIIPHNVYVVCCDVIPRTQLYFLLMLLTFLNASTDCIMYALSSREFRRKLKSVFLTFTNHGLRCLSWPWANNVVAPEPQDIPL